MSTNDISELKGLLYALRDEQRDMMNFLRGNPEFPSDKGLLGRIEHMESAIAETKTEIQRHREFGMKVIWTFGGAIGVLTFLVGVVVWAAEVFIK
jgi:hypothetical protein